MGLTKRSSSYTNEEDLHLCHVYLDISQNSIKGISQSKDQFWSRVEHHYNNMKPDSICQPRPRRSLQARMRVILTAVGKLRECVRQVENLNPSAASEQDILYRAKILLAQDKNYKKGFKFDHIWPILEDIENFQHDVNTTSSIFQMQIGNFASSQSKSPTSISPRSSSFGLNINKENVGGTLIERPIEVKKGKLKRKNDEENQKIIETIIDENQQLAEIFKKESDDRQQIFEIQMLRAQNESKKLALTKYREENKILLKDLNSISDSTLRKFFQNEQTRLLQKRAQQQGQESQSTYGSSGEYFDRLDY